MVLSMMIAAAEEDKDEAKAESSVIVGAGPTGLVTAIMLARRGWNVRVLEKRNKPEKANNADVWGILRGVITSAYPLEDNWRCRNTIY